MSYPINDVIHDTYEMSEKNTETFQMDQLSIKNKIIALWSGSSLNFWPLVCKKRIP